MANEETVGSSRIREIPIDAIIESDLQIRKYYDGETLVELANSLSEQGTLQPVIVRSRDGKFELLIGSRRLKAAQLIGAKFIPACILDNIRDRDVIEMALTENLQRQDLTPLEEAWAILRLIRDFKMGIQEVAHRIGRHESFVRKRMKLLNVPFELQEMIVKKQIPINLVDSIASIPSEDEQRRVVKEVTNHHLSHSDLMTLLKEEKGEEVRIRRDEAKLTGKRVQLKIDGFTRFIQSVTPLVLKMGMGEVLNVRVALDRLIREAQKIVKELEES